LKEIPYRDYHLSLAKIINDTLFFAFTDSQEILYAMELDNGKYEVKQYRHQIGIIQNIWLKEQENEEYVFTSERNKETISGIFKIIGQDSIEMAEIFDYKVAGYNTLDGTFVYCNPDSTLSYRNGNDPVGISIKEFMGNGETIYDIFFLEDGSFIIESTKTGPHHFANLLFGSGNLIHYFYYYHMKEDRHGNLKIKKIRTFGSHWKLEQLIFRGSGHE
jgi:hypothetical protein